MVSSLSAPGSRASARRAIRLVRTSATPIPGAPATMVWPTAGQLSSSVSPPGTTPRGSRSCGGAPATALVGRPTPSRRTSRTWSGAEWTPAMPPSSSASACATCCTRSIAVSGASSRSVILPLSPLAWTVSSLASSSADTRSFTRASNAWLTTGMSALSPPGAGSPPSSKPALPSSGGERRRSRGTGHSRVLWRYRRPSAPAVPTATRPAAASARSAGGRLGSSDSCGRGTDVPGTADSSEGLRGAIV